jgi:hypothetical protein
VDYAENIQPREEAPGVNVSDSQVIQVGSGNTQYNSWAPRPPLAPSRGLERHAVRLGAGPEVGLGIAATLAVNVANGLGNGSIGVAAGRGQQSC